MPDPAPAPVPAPAPAPVTILVDADACPVKEEIYRVAERFDAEVRVVSNSPFRVPVSARVKRVVVSAGTGGPKFDAADDWIADHADARSVVITADILLAERCVKAGARVLKHDGREFDAASIGSAVATRAIMEDLRAGMDGVGGGPPPFGKADRSNFLQALDRVLVQLRRS
ncbi:YaiI/YqxD family protein [Qipengyuania flava]|uniref:YaiI/YqxD family protein n=1 Tax=Qipengyuania flava TaxID=192812 RepID=UPI001AD958CD|nr:YaiI/YqxD family protein [Qipengyuania flava]MBO9504467.1 YaiI/YqxD family protein [Qipengyuania flava]